MWSSDLFKSEARKAQPYAQMVAARLRGAGIGCTADPLSIRDSIADIPNYAGQQDIELDAGGFIEVKSNRLRFTDDPTTFPYETALLKSVNSWNKFVVKPLAIVLVSRITHKMLWLNTDTEPAWFITRKFDRVRGITSTAYTVHRDYLTTFTAGVETLRRQTHGF